MVWNSFLAISAPHAPAGKGVGGDHHAVNTCDAYRAELFEMGSVIGAVRKKVARHGLAVSGSNEGIELRKHAQQRSADIATGAQYDDG